VPEGASGKFAADLLRQGVHLAGILKPRILVNNADGTPTKASAYATEHGFWYPGEHREEDYFTHRLAGNLDFGNPQERAWFWEHLIPSFQAGITAWWNDEADYSNKDVFNNFQFLNMARALYDGQRAISRERVWSINRAYYLGAARYGYALWSGDIATGFQSMAYQRRRMIASLDLGEPHWSMDTGGFDGHPTPENYARWMEFAAFVPIDRVHGNFEEKRQPWVYGPVAEAAASRALRLRYDLMPYIYANERHATETGVGLVRPLFWAFPDDPRTAEETRAWMFGDALLVSPIVEHGATSHALYLPEGLWFDYWSGRQIPGGREWVVPADAATWQNIPLFIRSGSIVASQDSAGADDALNARTLELDVFPSPTRAAEFTVYDDDGHTYAYEAGDFMRQQIVATGKGREVSLLVSPATGTYQSHLAEYLVRVHGRATQVAAHGVELRRFDNEASLRASPDAGWTFGRDRFGPMTLIRLRVDAVAAAGVTLVLR
jgi:alpha-glucosidase